MLRAFLDDVKKNAITHGSIPFWSWNDKLEEAELRRQINNMKKLNMNGFFMHARAGLETEYLSDEWFDAVNVCIDEAKKLGMEAWCYDENGWPSGFAGGRLLKDEKNFARYLKYEVREDFAEDAFKVYKVTGSVYKLLTEPEDGLREYHCIYIMPECSYVDILDKRIIKKFIEETYELYKKRIAPEDWGTVMPGFFTDEPQYYRYGTPWSNILGYEFSKRYGYDISDRVIELFLPIGGFRKLRYDYHGLIGDLYVNSFIKQVYDWCEENGCKITGHGIEENTLAGQLMCCGEIMEFYRYQHIPGVDWLCRPLRNDCLAKQLGSVCAQLGKDKAITESFALSGWDVLPRELKNIADFQYANGVNVTCQHLYAYSFRGQRKRDYPANFSEHLPWQKHLADFNSYYNNLGYMLSLGKEAVSTGVIHPVRNASMYFIHDNEPGRHFSQAKTDPDLRFKELSDWLGENQIAYHYLSETMTNQMAYVKDGKLYLGQCCYDKILVPDVETVTASTAELLRQFVQSGGRLYLQGNAPVMVDAVYADLSFLKAGLPMEELKRAMDVTVECHRAHALRVQTRMIGGSRLVFIANVKNTPCKDIRVTLKGASSITALDILSLKASALKVEDSAVVFDLGDSESLVLLENMPCENEYLPPRRDVFLPPKTVRFNKKPENALTLDQVSYSLDGVHFSEKLHLMQLKDQLLQERYKGRLYLQYSFDVSEIPDSVKLACEPMKYLSFEINGESADFDGSWWLDRRFPVCDLKDRVRLGKNTVTCSFDYYQSDYVYYVLYGGVSESLRNCLNFDTEIECMYLFGDFALETPGSFEEAERMGYTYRDSFSLKRSKDTLLWSNVICDGYPFFAGELDISFEHFYKKGDPACLCLKGRYHVAEISVNGEPADRLLFGDVSDLSRYLKEGNNRIDVKLTNSNRNLLGPHHHPEVEVYRVGPRTFTCEKLWKDGECKNYVKDFYAFVRFGVDCREDS